MSTPAKINFALLACLFGWVGLNWSALPAEIPIHFDSAGVPNGFGNRVFGAFFIPGICLLIAFIARIQIRVSKITGEKMSLALTGLLGSLHVLVLQQTMDGSSLVIPFTPLLLSLFFVYIGILLPDIEPNFWMGIRLPWIMESRATWKKTHIFGGRCFLILGLVSGALSLYQREIRIQITGALISLALTILASLFYARKFTEVK